MITNSIACDSAGVDPYIKDACNEYWKGHPDPSAPYQDLLLNYPPIWLKLKHVGASAATTHLFGIAIAFFAFISLWLIFRPKSRIGGLITIGAVLSPSVLLGFERGNIDLVIFALLVLTIVSTERLGHTAKQSLRGFGIVILTVLKFFPVVCITLLVRPRLNLVFGVVTAALAVGAAWFAADGRFASALMNTPKVDNLSFGSLPMLIGLKKLLIGDGTVTNGVSMLALMLSFAAFLCVLVPVLVKKLPRPFPQYLPMMEDNLNGNLALAGLSIFCSGFIFGASFDYRLIFLCLALPLLISAYEEAPNNSGRLLYAPVLIVVFLWLSRISVKIAYLDEVLDWTLFSVGSVWVFSTLFSRFNRNI